MMPKFNEKSPKDYPYFLVTGTTEVWIGNLERCTMDSLIKGSSVPKFSQIGVIFLKQRENTVDPNTDRFVFTSQYFNPKNLLQYQIHEMNLYSDFNDVLAKLGHLPEVTVDRVVELELELAKLKAQLAQQEEKKE